MTTADGTVLGTIKIVDHGLPWQRWDLLIMGDGYRQDELVKYHGAVDNFIDKLRHTRPFSELWNAINIYRVDVSSTDSGVDDPVACGGTGAAPRTYFDATWCANGERREKLSINFATALQVAQDGLAEADMILVLVNSYIKGGRTSGMVSVSSAHAPLANDVILHEMGHAAFGLADEYDYLSGCESPEPSQDRYPGREPVEPNVTIITNKRTIKWGHLIDPSTDLPTTSNDDCTKCDNPSGTEPSPVPLGTVGAFEGAYRYHCGIYRPEYKCKMKYSELPSFCAVCEEVIHNILSYYSHRDPVMVPGVEGMILRDARQVILCAGLVPRRDSSNPRNSVVGSQSPLPGSVAARGSTVWLKMVIEEQQKII